MSIVRADWNITTLHEVRFDPNLSDFQKLLLAEICQKTSSRGTCEKPDEFFADLYKKPVEIVSEGICKLKSLNFLFEFEDEMSGQRRLISCQDGLAKEIYEEALAEHNREKSTNKYITPKPYKGNGFVYLMIDRALGFHKIGYSKNPEYREKTLRADKPVIELVFKVQGSMDLEGELHALFSHKRIRGEWFDLSEREVKYIIKTYGEKL